MRVLVVKMTSMGDVLHLLPAISDLQRAQPDAKIDWMIEQPFSEVASWHPAIETVIPVASRRWRKFNFKTCREFISFWRELRKQRYDIVIDAQGLIKSAVFSRFAKTSRGARRIGFSADSIKEKPAARFYTSRIDIARNQHAVDRLRQLFAQGFEYSLADTEPNYQLNPNRANPDSNQVVFLHGTTWASKHLPESNWIELAKLAGDDGYNVLLPWGSDEEKARAERIAQSCATANILPKSSLTDLKKTIAEAAGAIAVDTGLGHLAAALGTPCISIYGATDAQLTGTKGKQQVHAQAPYPCSPCLLKQCNKLTEQVVTPPCYAKISMSAVWTELFEQLT